MHSDGPRIHIFDLDNCISDDTNRRHIALEGDYERYHSLCAGDPAINVDVVQAAVHHPRDQFLFLTGRSESQREATMHWLAHNFSWLSDHPTSLCMRPLNDTSPSAVLKIRMLEELELEPGDIHDAYDDRRDVLEAYRQWGIKQLYVLSSTEAVPYPLKVDTPSRAKTPDELLADMAVTFRARNSRYVNNYQLVGKVMHVLHGYAAPRPASELVGTEEQFNVWHLYELLIVKLTRFANSGLAHRDSIHDIAVYAAMIESLLPEEEEQ